MQATPEVRWFPPAYLWCPTLKVCWSGEECFPVCDRQAVHYTLLHLLDDIFFDGVVGYGFSISVHGVLTRDGNLLVTIRRLA